MKARELIEILKKFNSESQVYCKYNSSCFFGIYGVLEIESTSENEKGDILINLYSFLERNKS